MGTSLDATQFIRSFEQPSSDFCMLPLVPSLDSGLGHEGRREFSQLTVPAPAETHSPEIYDPLIMRIWVAREELPHLKICVAEEYMLTVEDVCSIASFLGYAEHGDICPTHVTVSPSTLEDFGQSSFVTWEINLPSGHFSAVESLEIMRGDSWNIRLKCSFDPRCQDVVEKSLDAAELAEGVACLMFGANRSIITLL